VVAHVLVLQRQRNLTEADMWIKPDTSGRGLAGGQKFVVGKVCAARRALVLFSRCCSG
jgi:hypothetical protein